MILSRNILILAVLLVCTTACQFKNAVLYTDPEPSKVPIRDHYVLLVLMDGARPEEVHEGVLAGRLPTIKKLFYDEGARFENAVTVFPTVSTPAHQAFVSGLQPGHHGVPGLDWFSRPLLRYIDYLSPFDIPYTNTLMFNSLQLLNGEVQSDAPQLIYSDLKGHQTMTVFEPANYGVTYQFPKKPPLASALKTWYLKSYEELDRKAIENTLKVFKTLPLEDLPRFSFISLYGTDLTSHYEGPKGPRTADLFVHYDRFINELMGTLKERGIWEKTTLILVSDHGQHELKGVVELPKILYKLGLKYDPSNPKKSQVMTSNHGTGTARLYLRVGDDWNERPSYHQIRNYPMNGKNRVDLIQKFLEDPDIEIVIAPEGPLKTHFHTTDAYAMVERKWEDGKFLYRYQTEPGKDPFDYLDNPNVAEWVKEGRFMDDDAWLRETGHLDQPDVVVSVPQLFDDYRAGEMMLLTVKHKQFKEDKWSGHGSLYSEDRKVPLFLHGPYIQPGVYPYIRTIDVYPMALALFGLENKAPMDGKIREEVFTHKFKYNHIKHLSKFPNQSQGPLNPTTFRNLLSKKLENNSLNEQETLKAKQMLYSIDQYLQDSWPTHTSKSKNKIQTSKIKN